MSQPTEKSNVTPPSSASKILGRREWIELVGLYKDSNRDNELIAIFRTGFLTAKNKKARTSKRTGVKLKKEAAALIEKSLKELQKVWDQAAEICPPNNCSASVVDVAKEETSAEQLLLELEEEWDGYEGKRRQTHKGYLYESRAFRRVAGQLVKRDPSEFTEEECEELRDTRLDELGSSADQCMANLRVVLRQLKGFPVEFIDLFRPLKKGFWQKQKRDFTFSYAERRELVRNFASMSWREQGMVLQGMFGLMHIREAALCKLDELLEAPDDVCQRRRRKNGFPFRFYMLALFKKWLEQRPRDPKGIYLHPEYVLTPEELADPKGNHTKLSAEEEEERATNAAAALRKEFDALLKRLKIKRPGLSYRSFRHTGISEFEAHGLARAIGMAITGQSDEANYLGYMVATPAQLRSAAELVFEVFRYPGRRIYSTITQATHALMRLVVKSEFRTRKQIQGLEAEIRELKMLLTRALAAPAPTIVISCRREFRLKSPPLLLGHSSDSGAIVQQKQLTTPEAAKLLPPASETNSPVIPNLKAHKNNEPTSE